MGNTEKPLQLKEIQQVLPQTPEEKAAMKKPYVHKPVPSMYFLVYLVCNFKLENNTSIALVAFLKSSLSVMDLIRELNSHQSNSQHRIRQTSCAFAKGVKKNHSVTTPTKDISNLTSDY